MSRCFKLFAVLLLLSSATGCSALGINHPLTGILPTSYSTKRVDSQLMHADYEVQSDSPNVVAHADYEYQQ